MFVTQKKRGENENTAEVSYLYPAVDSKADSY